MDATELEPTCQDEGEGKGEYCGPGTSHGAGNVCGPSPYSSRPQCPSTGSCAAFIIGRPQHPRRRSERSFISDRQVQRLLGACCQCQRANYHEARRSASAVRPIYRPFCVQGRKQPHPCAAHPEGEREPASGAPWSSGDTSAEGRHISCRSVEGGCNGCGGSRKTSRSSCTTPFGLGRLCCLCSACSRGGASPTRFLCHGVRTRARNPPKAHPKPGEVGQAGCAPGRGTHASQGAHRQTSRRIHRAYSILVALLRMCMLAAGILRMHEVRSAIQRTYMLYTLRARVVSVARREGRA